MWKQSSLSTFLISAAVSHGASVFFRKLCCMCSAVNNMQMCTEQPRRTNESEPTRGRISRAHASDSSIFISGKLRLFRSAQHGMIRKFQFPESLVNGAPHMGRRVPGRSCCSAVTCYPGTNGGVPAKTSEKRRMRWRKRKRKLRSSA